MQDVMRWYLIVAVAQAQPLSIAPNQQTYIFNSATYLPLIVAIALHLLLNYQLIQNETFVAIDSTFHLEFEKIALVVAAVFHALGFEKDVIN